MAAAKKKTEHKPEWSLPRYPLELSNNLHICLWSEDGDHKWTVAYFDEDREGPSLQFVGERPLDERVSWAHFRELVVWGYSIAQERFDAKRPRD